MKIPAYAFRLLIALLPAALLFSCASDPGPARKDFDMATEVESALEENLRDFVEEVARVGRDRLGKDLDQVMVVAPENLQVDSDGFVSASRRAMIRDRFLQVLTDTDRMTSDDGFVVLTVESRNILPAMKQLGIAEFADLNLPKNLDALNNLMNPGKQGIIGFITLKLQGGDGEPIYTRVELDQFGTYPTISTRGRLPISP